MTLEQELRARLINVETKINTLLERTNTENTSWSGHADQVFGHLTYAQHGEDVVVAGIFHKLGITRPTYLDIGAHHPLNISNTALLYCQGSRGINVEANPDLIEAFVRHRPEDKNLNIGIAPQDGVLPFYRIDNFSGRNSFDLFSIEDFITNHPQFKLMDTLNVPVITVNNLIKKYNDNLFPNFLSIDVEGLDFEILRTADFAGSRPVLICVEVVSGANKNESVEMVKMLREKRFEPVFSTPGNIILADASVSAKASSIY